MLFGMVLDRNTRQVRMRLNHAKSGNHLPTSQSRLLEVLRMCTEPCSVAMARSGTPPFFAAVNRV